MSTSLTFDILARDRASDKFDRVGKSASSSSDKLKKFAKVGALAVAGAAVVAGKALFDMTKSAMEDEKAQGILAQSMKNAAGANKQQVAQVEKWISAQGKAKGIADDELRPAMARLVQATGDVHKSQKLASLAMDVSAGTGKSLKSVTDALAKAQTGSTGGLAKMGIAVKNADDSMKPLAQITRELADLHGGQSARAAETTEGKFKRLKVMYDETKESIGAKLIPVADKLATLFMDKVAPAAGKVGDWFQQKVMPPLRDFAEKAAPKARDIMTAVKGAFEDSKPFLALVGQILTNVVVPGFKKLLDVAGPMLVNQIKGIGKILRFVGEAGTWMWNNALQPAFKFMVKGIGWVMDGWSKMLGAMSNVPGFGWAKKASEDMAKAADKAYAMAEGIKKIPPNKKVYVTVTYTYKGLRGPGGAGSTRGGADDPSSYLPRANVTKSAGERFMEILADGMKAGGKKVDQVLAASRDRVKTAVGQIRDDMKSMSESIASAINPTDFGGGLAELMASLTGNNGALSGLTNVFAALKGSVSKGFLSSLMQSGNTGLATALGNDPAAAAEASRIFDANAALAGGLGDQSAEAVLGDRIDEIYKRETDRLLKKEDDLPKAIRKELRELFRDGLELRLTGGTNPGQRAHLRGAF